MLKLILAWQYGGIAWSKQKEWIKSLFPECQYHKQGHPQNWPIIKQHGAQILALHRNQAELLCSLHTKWCLKKVQKWFKDPENRAAQDHVLVSS